MERGTELQKKGCDIFNILGSLTFYCRCKSKPWNRGIIDCNVDTVSTKNIDRFLLNLE